MTSRKRILIVDDNRRQLETLGQMITAIGHECVYAENGPQAMVCTDKIKPDLILLDIQMPVMNGFEVCKIIKKQPETKDIPVVFITSRTEPDEIVQSFAAGGNDYITKPFNRTEIDVRINNQLKIKEYQDQLRHYNELLKKKNTALNTAMHSLEEAARTDPLTGLWNRRAMYEKLSNERKRFERHQQAFSIVIGDVDHFKRFNDTWGHNCGDFVLKSVAEIIKNNLRAQDIVSRWGGEEFLLVLPETQTDGAVTKMESLRRELSEKIFEFNQQALRITITFGIAGFVPHLTVDECIIRADSALYEGKKNGRNCVCVFGAAMPSNAK